MHIDASLGIVPTATATIHKAASLRTAIIGILGIEDIINLAQEADVRSIILLAPLLHWQAVLEIEIRGRIRTKHGILVLRIVEILFAHDIGLHRSCKTRHIKTEER